jgi:uncharacterized protein
MSSNGPVEKKARIGGLDALRGLAIFGILVVNVLQMFVPMYLASWPVEIVPGESGMWTSWFLTDAFFENKFITIFSLLFGAGFGLQMLRKSDSRRKFRRLYLRRIGVLIAFGLVHAIFFYMADVLVIYGLTALLLLPFRNWPARRLFWVGGVLLGLMVVWNAVLSGPHNPEMAEMHRAVARQIAEIRSNRVIQLENTDFALPRTIELEDAFLIPSDQEGRATLSQTEFPLPMPADLAILVLDGNNEPEQAKVQYAVFSEGPLRAARFGRVIFLAALLILYTPFYLAWRTLALFMLGVALVKWGYLEMDRRRLWRRVSVIGFAWGLPLTLAASAIRALEYEKQSNLVYLGGVLHDVSSLILAAAISSVVFYWCASSRRNPLRVGLAAVGRTALTNYVGQSVVMSLIATSYGLGLYGDLTHLQLLWLSMACFLVQMGVSVAWLRQFRMGPLEWIWRCLTYWQLLPLRGDPSS